MRRLTTSEIALACGGEIVSGPGDAAVCRISTDSRAAGAGDCFFALRGGHFDGHDFARAAAASGAAAVVVEREIAGAEGTVVIRVADALRALQRLAAWYRASLTIPVVAIGGSNGKTSTKELVAAALSAGFCVAKTRGNLNNHIGAPLTLLEIGPEHGAAVVELGTNHPGEIAALAAIAAPTVGVITNIGPEHLEFFGDEAGVANEEGSLLDSLREGHAAVLNADDRWVGELRSRARCRVITGGLGHAADLRVEVMGATDSGQRLRAHAGGESAEFDLPLHGNHMAQNAALAMATGLALGLRLGAMAASMGGVTLPSGRMRCVARDGIRMIDDSYNANPGSMRAALGHLAGFTGRRIAVLGTMGEMGAGAAALHREVGGDVRRLGIDLLVAVGPFSGDYRSGAGGGTAVFEDVAGAVAFLRGEVRAGDTVLVKASRAAKFELIAEALGFGAGCWEGAKC
ncbi:MAG TPA: UDP-N-acetylmuramoyl-tripeptide--D-alanyl-D-alanine ligase [Verrucomicrobiae bacterium]|nr:UDP-N-acetylmuramoyl-tripeptide--D-alanyl-D-alanine ligase [Verrucomicrobiae bacterium]